MGMDAGTANSLKIDVLTDYFPPHVGGVERVVDEVCRQLARQGHRLRVFTFNTDGAPAHEEIDGVQVYRAAAIQMARLTGMQASLSPGLLPLAWGVARTDPPDVIHAHNLFFTSTLAATVLRRFLNRPLVTTLHLGSLRYLGGTARILASSYERTVGRLIIRNSDRITAVSETVASHALWLGARPESLRLIANGVDVHRFRPAEPGVRRASRVACVGRLIFNKGPQYLLEAVPEILRAHPETEFVFVGDGPLRPTLEERTRELGVAHQVTFLGARHDVAEILRECDMLVRPSLLEGMPLTVLEGMASGLPIVATPVAGTVELVRDGENGVLVPPADPVALARAITRLIADPSLRSSMGISGRRLVTGGYSWDSVATRTLDVYRELFPPAKRRAAAPPRTEPEKLLRSA